ncbi:MAG: hypothetical protein IPP78_05210 [Holophagaceae bacterium]|nr:hypothetical protein [Holophagaceae bacterium]
MNHPLYILLACAAMPMAAQWDARLEIPYPKGQSLPQTMISGSAQLVSGDLDTGRGGIVTLSRRLWAFGPVVRLEGGFEIAQWQADGLVTQGSVQQSSTLKQSGVGVGLHAQFWIPFTGIAGEFGVIERLQNYQFSSSGFSGDKNLARTWLRVGARWRLPFPVVHPYIAASYQQPITKDNPVKLGSVSDFTTYMSAQGTGLEFDRMWTFGVGFIF